jgi:TRAP-type C4-dicarboxylate transport system permease small subunit
MIDDRRAKQRSHHGYFPAIREPEFMATAATAVTPPVSDPPGPVGKLLEQATEVFALIGGLVMLGIMLVQSVSVAGRSLPDILGLFGLKVPRLSIPGDIEIVQLGCGIAIFFFLPLCQYRRANVLVEFFTQNLPVRFRSFFDLLANILFLLLVSAITWQLGHGTVEKFAYRDTTMVLRIPESYPYLAALIAAVLWTIVTAYSCARSVQEIGRNRAVGPLPSGDH